MSKTALAAARRRKHRPRYGVRLMRLTAAAALAGTLWLGYLLVKIDSFKPGPLQAHFDAGIVLGAALWNGEPSPGLRERLDLALELYEEGRFGRFILTGGRDYDSAALTEAEGMRNYLIAHGVPEDRIVLETEAQSTYDNLLYSKAIMEREGMESALIITHDFHASRAYDIARYLEYMQPGIAVAQSRVLPAAQKHPREVLAYTKWKLDSVLLRFGLMIPDRRGI